MDYIDDILFLQNYIEEHYGRLNFKDPYNYVTLSKNKEIARASESKYWASHKALYTMFEDTTKDPWEVIDSLLGRCGCEVVFAKQDINKEHFSIACDVLEDLKRVLKERRN